ncbi:hypothetical protein BCR35DRAFT_331731 [Leucosporidium creatinivorum]|uniref:Uncharacterized protein n=1 Tax=Leucosporidium creatinivorum TaxID=106004 RepID=A0A1Y2F9U5_9BASI|nr:hypothetical protein BCR35DRAFT_331731 [Leucosporidium creatinivorum]
MSNQIVPFVATAHQMAKLPQQPLGSLGIAPSYLQICDLRVGETSELEVEAFVTFRHWDRANNLKVSAVLILDYLASCNDAKAQWRHSLLFNRVGSAASVNEFKTWCHVAKLVFGEHEAQHYNPDSTPHNPLRLITAAEVYGEDKPNISDSWSNCESLS